jgi:hypothetical protein
MIIIKIQGGLGNQLFQYALGRKLSLMHNVPFKLDIEAFENEAWGRIYRLNEFTIVEHIASKKEIQKYTKYEAFLKKWRPVRSILARLKLEKKFLDMVGLKREHQFNFDPNILKIKDNALLDGYYQTEKYFKDIEDIIRKDFEFKYNPNPANAAMLEKICSVESVCIHVRRGNFITDRHSNNWHGICSPEYFEKALAEIKKRVQNPYFFIFSDDKGWVRNNLKIENSMVVDINGADADFEDLRLMSTCNHFILANSSFSWWGAWLSKNKNKVVLIPSKIYKTTKNNTVDFTPKEWMQIETKLI